MSSRDSLFDKIGYNLIHVKTIDSTNTFLKNNYESFSDRSILWTDEQTSGRGRMLRKWVSNDDLIFSILYKIEERFPIIAPLSIVLALNDYDISSQIKWPNDIYINGKKLSGILIEKIYNDSFKSVIVGIGLNYFDKTEVDGIGLNNFLKIDKEELIFKIVSYIEKLIRMPSDFIIEKYKDHSLIINQNIMYHNEIYLACGFNLDGTLVLSRDGKFINVTSDEIDIKSSIIK